MPETGDAACQQLPRVCSEGTQQFLGTMSLACAPPLRLACGRERRSQPAQVSYPLAALFPSPSSSFCAPCRAPEASLQLSRSRSAGGGPRARVVGGCPLVQGCRRFPKPGAGAADPIHTASSNNNALPIRAAPAHGSQEAWGSPLASRVLRGQRARVRATQDRSHPARGPGRRLPGAAHEGAGRAGVSGGGGRCPRCPIAAHARA